MPATATGFHTAAATLERALVDVEAGTLAGTAAHWNAVNANGWSLERGAFADWIASGRRPVLLWQHDENQPIGVVSDLHEGDAGLEFAAALNLETERGRETRSLLRQGAIAGVSIGMKPKAHEIRDGHRHFTVAELWELSLVTFPADSQAQVSEVANAHPLSTRTRLIRARIAALTLEVRRDR